jgi:cytochrome c5
MSARVPPGRVSVLAAVGVLASAFVMAQQVEYPELQEGNGTLRLGREIWLGTCATCHTDDFTGAPQVTDPADWEPRIAKGKDALYASAMNGLFGPMGTEMPARGDNATLTDEEIRAAVDYMVALVEYLDTSTQQGRTR